MGWWRGFFPSPCWAGLGGGVSRQEISRRYWHRPLPPSPSRKGRGSILILARASRGTPQCWGFAAHADRLRGGQQREVTPREPIRQGADPGLDLVQVGGQV